MTLIDDKKIIVDTAMAKINPKFDDLVNQIKPILKEIKESYIKACVAEKKKTTKLSTEINNFLKKNKKYGKFVKNTEITVKDQIPDLKQYKVLTVAGLQPKPCFVFNQLSSNSRWIHLGHELWTGYGRTNEFPKDITAKVRAGIEESCPPVNGCSYYSLVRMTDTQYKKLSKPMNELTNLIDSFNNFQDEITMVGIDTELKSKLDNFLKKIK